MSASPRFFPSQTAARRWLERNHATATELLVGFHRLGSGLGGATYGQVLDEALCFGWIDGVRRRIDASSFSIRFTPRKPRSIWSNVNIRRVEELSASAVMAPSGLAAYARRDPARSGIYAFERGPQSLSAEQEANFRADPGAWNFFAAQPPGYRRVAIHWVISAKREETRTRRLAQLVADSAAGRRLAQLVSPSR